MKIQSLFNNVGYSSQVREKKDDSSSRQNQSGSQNSNHQQNSKDRDRTDSPDPQLVSDAVGAFQADLQAQANGLSATLENEGPGLKVILTDKAGGIVRRLTGEEFLRLRDAASPESKTSGKLLDRKL